MGERDTMSKYTKSNNNNIRNSKTNDRQYLRLVQTYAVHLILLPCVVQLPNIVDGMLSPAYADPHFQPQRNGIVQLYEWKFSDVANECTQFLGPQGFAGVQLSVVTEHLLWEHLPYAWPMRYQPISYELRTQSGDATAFLEMSHACNTVGVRVYVEVVLNHMARPRAMETETATTMETETEQQELRGTGDSTANVTSFDYPGVPYDRRDFHAPCAVSISTTTNDAYAYRNCQLVDTVDLDQSRLHVRERLIALLDRLVDLGTAGFRVLNAKCMWPNELQQIFDAVKNLNSEEFDFPEQTRPFFYMDMDDFNTMHISKTEYTELGLVTENLYAEKLYEILVGRQQLSSIINVGPGMGFLPHQDAVVYVDKLTAQNRSGRTLSYNVRSKHIMATAFMLAHPYGNVKLIMSSFHQSNEIDDGPPLDDNNSIASPDFNELGQCAEDSGWICEHRWPAIVNMIALVNELNDVEDGLVNLQTDGADHVAFCRGNKAFIAFNNHYSRDYEADMHTCLEAGTYCDVISGELTENGAVCTGRKVEVNEEGVAKVLIPFVDDEDESGMASAVAIYLGSKVKPKEGRDEVLDGENFSEEGEEQEEKELDNQEDDVEPKDGDEDVHDEDNETEVTENDEDVDDEKGLVEQEYEESTETEAKEEEDIGSEEDLEGEKELTEDLVNEEKSIADETKEQDKATEEDTNKDNVGEVKENVEVEVTSNEEEGIAEEVEEGKEITDDEKVAERR